MTTDERTRLHITPFTPALLVRYVPPALQPVATNISYHTVDTFPERPFGYIELPISEAQKLRQKLNGTMLKGTKVRIEEAKPERKRKGRENEEGQQQKEEGGGEAARDEDDGTARNNAKREKTRRKVGELVIEGHELPDGRHVKRGWAEDKTKSKKSGKKDDGIKDKKMKFKTVVPPNKIEVDKEGGKKSRTKEKKEQEEKKSGRKEVLVTEGKKSSRPAAGGKARKGELRYEEGQGWVNEDGKVVEGETEKQKQKRKRERKAAEEAGQESVPETETEVQQDYVVEEAPQRDTQPDDAGPIEIAHASLSTRESWSGDEDTASSHTVSSVSAVSSDSGSESEPEPHSDADTEDGLDKQLAQARSNTASNKNTQTPEATAIPVGAVQEKEVHPLEALFKRPASKFDQSPRPKPTAIDTSFSFFDAGSDADDNDDGATAELRIPQTPRTKEDLEWRGQRSAAPTPDTAAIGKRFDFSFTAPDRGEEGEDEDMVDAELEQAKAGEGEEKEESEFRKWFYENRGALNRGWKRRRKDERKSLRQRENRRVGRKVA